MLNEVFEYLHVYLSGICTFFRSLGKCKKLISQRPSTYCIIQSIGVRYQVRGKVFDYSTAPPSGEFSYQ